MRQKTRVEGVNKVEGMLLLCHETENVFEELRKEVEMLMWRDSYPRFLKHHLAYNASKSLEWYPGKTFTFKGLGECFCITNPRSIPLSRVFLVSFLLHVSLQISIVRGIYISPIFVDIC